jgi:hypothetical protein
MQRMMDWDDSMPRAVPERKVGCREKRAGCPVRGRRTELYPPRGPGRRPTAPMYSG